MSALRKQIDETKARRARFDAAALRHAGPIVSNLPVPKLREADATILPELRKLRVPAGSHTTIKQPARPVDPARLVAQSEYPSAKLIQHHVAMFYGATRVDLVSSRRNHELIVPRHVAIWLCRQMTPLSLPKIGNSFGGRDHTSQIYAINKISRMVISDQWFAHDVAWLEQRILAAFENPNEETLSLQSVAMRPTIAAIQQETCAYFGIKLSDLLGSSLCLRFLQPRSIAMYIARQMTFETLESIMAAFERRSETGWRTVCRIEAKRLVDDRIDISIKEIQRMVWESIS